MNMSHYFKYRESQCECGDSLQPTGCISHEHKAALVNHETANSFVLLISSEHWDTISSFANWYVATWCYIIKDFCLEKCDNYVIFLLILPAEASHHSEHLYFGWLSNKHASTLWDEWAISDFIIPTTWQQEGHILQPGTVANRHEPLFFWQASALQRATRSVASNLLPSARTARASEWVAGRARSQSRSGSCGANMNRREHRERRTLLYNDNKGLRGKGQRVWRGACVAVHRDLSVWRQTSTSHWLRKLKITWGNNVSQDISFDWLRGCLQ